jgi:hypothetical protein
MHFDKPRIIKASKALADFFGESRPFIVTPPECARELLDLLKSAGIAAEMPTDSFDSDGEALTCILILSDSETEYDQVRKLVRQFNKSHNGET